jgi:hypothetical protein
MQRSAPALPVALMLACPVLISLGNERKKDSSLCIRFVVSYNNKTLDRSSNVGEKVKEDEMATGMSVVRRPDEGKESGRVRVESRKEEVAA